MKLSHTMLNFLGYVADGINAGWCDKCEPEAFLSHFGAVAAFKNKLLEPGTLELAVVDDPKANAIGLGLGGSYPGYVLTERGRQLGAIGARMRADEKALRPPCAVTEAYIAEGQALLDTWARDLRSAP